MWLKIALFLYFSYGILSSIRHSKETLKGVNLDNTTLALVFQGNNNQVIGSFKGGFGVGTIEGNIDI